MAGFTGGAGRPAFPRPIQQFQHPRAHVRRVCDGADLGSTR